MQFSAAPLPLALLVSYVTAQSSAVAAPAAATGSSSGTCQGQNVLDACLSSTTAIANACQSTDYNCLCTSWNAVLICYNECPNDSGYAGALSNKQTYCNNAAVYTSTSSAAISRDWSTSAAASMAGTETAARSATRTGGSNTASATRSAASAENSSGAGERRVGSMMGVLGGVGAVAAVFL